jgi:hypothetical protein
MAAEDHLIAHRHQRPVAEGPPGQDEGAELTGARVGGNRSLTVHRRGGALASDDGEHQPVVRRGGVAVAAGAGGKPPSGAGQKRGEKGEGPGRA